MTKRGKNTILFSGFLLLGGFNHLFDPEPHHFLITIWFCVEYLIYTGLILSWMRSVNERLLPGKEKRYLLSAAAMSLLILAVQAVKYRIAVGPWLIRYCWYLYYVPYLLIPALFLMTCLCFGRGTGRDFFDEKLLLIPALLLAAGILTNDIHFQAFVPTESLTGMTGGRGTYTHGFLYYAACAWIGCTIAAGLILLLAFYQEKKRKKALWPVFFLVLMPVLIFFMNLLPKPFRMYEDIEIFIFCLIGVFEACIRTRLIPGNENYPDFFARTDLPVLITDRQLNPVFRTRFPVPAEKEQLERSLQSPVYLTPDVRLSGMEIQAGYAFRTEDESTVNRLNEELGSANEILSMENEILKREQELTEEQRKIEEWIRIYGKTTREVYPTQKKIQQILENAYPGSASFRQDIEKTLVLTAYVKRKANFILVEEERGAVSAKELAAALEESAHYLRYCGMNTVVDVRTEATFPCRQAMAAYDSFEAAVEELLGKTADLFVRLQDREMLIMAETSEIPELSGMRLPVRRILEDGHLILRFVLAAALETGNGKRPGIAFSEEGDEIV